MNRGGAEMRTIDVMRFINRESYQLDFCVLSGLQGELDAEIVHLGGKIHLQKLNLLFPLRFIQLLKRERYDAVHSHVLYVSGIILLLARVAGVSRRIAHFRSTGSGVSAGIVRRTRDQFLRFLIDKSATNILAVSNGAMESAWTSFVQRDSRCLVVYNGIDLDQFQDYGTSKLVRQSLGISETCSTYIHVGRFDDAKNHEKLIGIFAEIHARNSSSVLILVGGGTDIQTARIRMWIEKCGVGGSVLLLGVRSDVPKLLFAADAMIFPSLWEGLPGAVLESCAAGTPVIASALPGTVEIADRFHTVKCIDVKASDEMWADCIESAMASDISMTDAINSFKSSEFTVHSASQKLMRVWRGDRFVDA